jgi:zinc transport system permease protein
MFDFLASALAEIVAWINGRFEVGSFFNVDCNVYAIVATLLVSLVCGSVGPLVVGQRMAFFSDALAHCAFAGVACGLLVGMIVGVAGREFREWIFIIMICFGVGVALLMVFVQETSGLPSDTIIGVFFAGAIGLGAIFLKTVGGHATINLEDFLFGDPLGLKAWHVVLFFFLALATWVVLTWSYNTLVFTSFNKSLALSRGMLVRLQSYLFVVLLALIVNVCQYIIGVLLVNALLIVPAATAANFARNMRQLFWGSILLCLAASWGGIALAWEIELPDPLAPGHRLQFGVGGMIVVLCVLFFIASLRLGPVFKNRAQQTA